MNKNQIEYMMSHCTIPDSCKDSELKETHVSWLILSNNFAFKIKRPVKYSFLDFTTPDKRKFYCNQEVKLNRRMEPDMYLGVIPVTGEMAGPDDGTDRRLVIDHAVQMKRMDANLEMDKMLIRDEVTEQHIDKLAKKIAKFHKKIRTVKNAFGTLAFHEKFADVQSVGTYIAEKSGSEWKLKIDECVNKSFEYLNSIRNYSNQRVISGFQKDCHGDLNATNIFLYDDPVIYDCIEFNSGYRKIDVLNEIAFLCVDLEFFGKMELSELFYKKYLEYCGFTNDSQSQKLFTFYKSYRASVRTKVTLISLGENFDGHNGEALDDAKKYILMMDNYLKDF